jgi:hypothetical protein
VYDDLENSGSAALRSSRDGIAGGEGDPKEHEGMSEGRDSASHLLKTAG